MKESLHYLLMSDHFLFQKSLVASVKDTGLTPGQPKILDYLINHDGAIQREIAVSCQYRTGITDCYFKRYETRLYRTQNGWWQSPLLSCVPYTTRQKICRPAQPGVCTHRSQSTGSFSDSDAGLLQELLGRVYENMTEIQKEGTTHK